MFNLSIWHFIALAFFFGSAHSSMFEVSDADDRPVATILGSIHSYDLFASSRPEDRALKAKIFKAITGCKKAYLEHTDYKLADLVSSYFAKHTKDLMISDDLYKFSEMFSTQEQEMIVARFETNPKLKGAVGILDKIRPWAISLMLLNSTIEEDMLKKKLSKGMDTVIHFGLQEEKKPVLPLETLNTLMTSVYVELPGDSKAAEWIKHSISLVSSDLGIDLQPPFGESPEIWEIFMKNFPIQASSPILNDAVNVARNTLWADVLSKDFKENKDTFICVGIGHLYGANNLLKQLEDKGYKIKNVG